MYVILHNCKKIIKDKTIIFSDTDKITNIWNYTKTPNNIGL
jgi:hypothetical protein